jgi:hypothetical protein
MNENFKSTAIRNWLSLHVFLVCAGFGFTVTRSGLHLTCNLQKAEVTFIFIFGFVDGYLELKGSLYKLSSEATWPESGSISVE